MIRVAIVDDNQINRITIKEKLLPYQNIKLVFEAINGENYFEKLKHKLQYKGLAKKRPLQILKFLD